MLVAAVLRPEEGEDRQLEVVRLALEQADDALELPVGQPESTMQWLFGDLRQVGQCSRSFGPLQLRTRPVVQSTVTAAIPEAYGAPRREAAMVSTKRPGPGRGARRVNVQPSPRRA
jgi:hypothetical protein